MPASPANVIAAVCLTLALTCVVGPLLALYLATLVGPILHFRARRAEARELSFDAALHNGVIPGLGRLDVVLAKGRTLTLAYRWSPTNAAAPPVLLMPGLGTSLVLISPLHDAVERAGQSALSFDLPGMGFAPAASPMPTPDETAQLVKALLDHVAPGRAFLFLAGSFGNTLAELVLARSPGACAGLLNLDGLPHCLASFPDVVSGFNAVARMYRAEAALSRVGFLRPFLATVAPRLRKSLFARSSIPWQTVYAHIQSAELLDSIARDAPRMMEVGAAVQPAFGLLSPPLLDPDLFDAVLRLAPDAVAVNTASPERLVQVTPSHSSSSANDDNKARCRAELLALVSRLPPGALPRSLARIPVFSVSCRDYSYDKREWFMTPKIKGLYAVEHAVLALISVSGGKRVVLPDVTHPNIIFTGDFVSGLLKEMAANSLAMT